MRFLGIALFALLLAEGFAYAKPAPACPPVSAFGLGLTHLDGYRFYLGKDGNTAVEPYRITAKQVPMLKTGKTLSVLSLPLAAKRGDEIVVGAADVDIPMHAAPAPEMFIMLSGSVTVYSPHFHTELFPGSVLFFDDVGSKTGHGGRTGPCGYISLSIAP